MYWMRPHWADPERLWQAFSCTQKFFTAKFADHSSGVSAVIISIPVGIPCLSDPSCGIPAAFIPIPTGNPQILWDSRHPNNRAHLYLRQVVHTAVCHQRVQFGTGQTTPMLHGWKANYRPGGKYWQLTAKFVTDSVAPTSTIIFSMILPLHY